MAGGPVGAVVGGAAGLIGGLLDDKEDVPAFQDLSDPKISAIAQALMRKKLGAKYAARQKALNTHNAQTSMEKVDNQGALGLSQRAGAYNAINRSAEESNVSANLSGASQDQAAQTQAASLIQANENLSMQRNEFNRQGWQMNQQPSAFESLAGTALSSTLGQYTQGKLNPQGSTQPDPSGAIGDKTVANASIPDPVPPVSAPMPAQGQSEWDSMKPLEQYDFQQGLTPKKTWSSGINNVSNHWDDLMKRFGPSSGAPSNKPINLDFSRGF